MSAVAAEAAAPAAEGGAAGGAASEGGGGSGGGLGQLGGGAGLPAGDVREKSKGVLLAIAVVLLWLAGLAFFIALEGSQLLAEQDSTGGAGFFQGIVAGLQRKALTAAGQDSSAGEGGASAGEGSGGSLGN